MEQMPTPTRLFPYPNSWYVIENSENLKPLQLMEKQIAGKNFVLFRTASGEVCLSDAHCPHLGGHFAHGGHVEGETMVCPFHYFCFDTAGTCVKTGYGTKPPPKAVLKTYTVRERNGFILYWHHENEELPVWEVPETDDSDWTEIKTTDFRVSLKSWGVILKKIILHQKDYRNQRPKITATLISIRVDGLLCY